MEPDEVVELTASPLAPVSEHDQLRAALRSRAGIRQTLLLVQVLAPPVAKQRRQASGQAPNGLRQHSA